MGNKKIPVLERLWSRVDTSLGHGPNGDCWLWTGAGDIGGYGNIFIRIRGKSTGFKAHRMVFMIANGGKIPEGMCVCHTCDNPPCVNPSHLWLGTIGDNHKDMDRKGRRKAGIGSRHRSAKLTEADIPKIKSLYKEGKTFAELVAMFGVSHNSITGVLKGRTWKHTP